MARDPMQLAVSTDVVMDNVLKHLKVTDLLNCRQVSKFWNRASSSVLRRRSAMITRLYNEENLMDLEKCIKQNPDFPFAGLQFHQLWPFGSGCATEFFQKYGDRFTRLRLDALLTRRLQDEAPFINHLTRLSILEMRPPMHTPWDVPQDGNMLKLPSVRTIRITWPSMGLVNEEILRQIITAAAPSVQIECLDVNPEIVRALKSAGKLRAVSIMEFYGAHGGDPNKWRTEMSQLLSTESPSLTKLDLHGCGCLSFHGLSQILSTSQHTLKELHFNVSWLNEYSWENFPVLPKLTKLSLLVANSICHVSLFRGKHGHKFPALIELHLYFDGGFENGTVGHSSYDGLFMVPSVTTINLKGHIDEAGMELLAQSFPNVVDMRLDHGYYSGDLRPGGCNPFEIWNVRKFKCLEKLRVWNFVVKQSSNDYINMDSFLTGIPVEICKNLDKQKNLDLNSPVGEVLRENPCILQLENLKELVVCVKPESGLKKFSEDPPFISSVSVRYAFEMMPNLGVKFVYEDFYYDHRKIAVLQAAFKHVQPYVKLERSFC